MSDGSDAWAMAPGMARWQERFRRDGVVRLAGVLAPSAMQHAEAIFAWSRSNPGPHAGDVYAHTKGAFFQDHANPAAKRRYRDFAIQTGIASLVATILGTRRLWLLYEQIWLKEGAATRRTPWHQDLPYVPMAGEHMATAWITLDAVTAGAALEFVRGSHHGPLYNPTAFNAHDERAAMFEDGIWPPLPCIDRHRAAFPIMRWAVRPGDVLLFHPATLHGGAATPAGGRRRTISLRVFGDDVVCAPRPDQGVAEIDRLAAEHPGDDPIRMLAHRAAGAPFRHAAFARLL